MSTAESWAKPIIRLQQQGERRKRALNEPRLQ